MRPRSLLPLVATGIAALLPTTLRAQSRLVDEATFVVLKGGAPTRTESFRITRSDAGMIATANLTAGSQQTTSSLTTDTLGSPLLYEVRVRDKGAKVVELKAVARSGRLTAMASSGSGDESMREYPITPGRSVILEAGLLNQLFFVPLGKNPGTLQVIEPRELRMSTATLTARGMEPVDVAGRAITGTHYSLSTSSALYEFWVDAKGRLLRVDFPREGLSATREEPPR